jgi:alpha-glucosidase (family GH31 glycosyl hydrolase)
LGENNPVTLRPANPPRLALLGLLFPLAAACHKDKPPFVQAPVTAQVGAFTVTWTGPGLRIADTARPEQPLLETASLTGQDAPLAARRTTSDTWQELYGQFKLTEGQEAWTGSARWVSDPQDPTRATARDDLGEPLATVTLSSPSEGALLLEAKAAPLGPLAAQQNRLALSFLCAAGDHFLGFGEQSDALDHHGHTINFWTSEPGIGKTNTDDSAGVWFLVGNRHGSSVGLPTWLSNRGYLGAVETQKRAKAEVCSRQQGTLRLEVWEDTLRLWLFRGPAPAQALARATAGLLGRQMKPLPLVFAPWNDAIYGSANVRRVQKLLRDRHIPSSVIWSEDFRGGAAIGDDWAISDEYGLDRGLYPDAETVAAELHKGGFLWLAYFFSFAVQGTVAYPQAVQGGHLIKDASGAPYLFQGSTFKPTSLVDLSSPAARTWMKAWMASALDLGFDGWMADFGEWLPHDARLASGEDGLAAHNRYGGDWSKLSAELLAEHDTGRPRVFFSRSGWYGTQAGIPVHWPGDQRTDFEPDDGLPTIVPMALNLGLAGWSTTGSDIGGYQSATNPPTTKELFFRWSTLGALEPSMRTHHGRTAKKNWQFDGDEETLAHYARWARFHMRLFPYLDGGAFAHETTGLPLMRALPLAYPADEAGWTLYDQYLLGPSLLVAPVQEAGKVSRKVHFPAGRWLPFSGGAPVDGPADVEVAAPLTEIPLFAVQGAVIPLLRAAVDTLAPVQAGQGFTDLAVAQASRTLLVFSGAPGAFAERDATYQLAQAATEADGFRENGAALPACAGASDRGCVEASLTPEGARRVRLAGSGPLGFSGHLLTIAGPGAARSIDVEIR